MFWLFHGFISSKTYNCFHFLIKRSFLKFKNYNNSDFHIYGVLGFWGFGVLSCSLLAGVCVCVCVCLDNQFDLIYIFWNEIEVVWNSDCSFVFGKGEIVNDWFADYLPFQVWKHSGEVGFLDNGRLKDEFNVSCFKFETSDECNLKMNLDSNSNFK